MKQELAVKNKSKIIKILKLSTLILAGTILLIFIFISKCKPFDFSQNYRKVDGWADIVFKDSWTNQYFCRCIWGLKISENYDNFQDHRSFDKNSYEYKILSSRINAANVSQIALSPDGKQILYVENIYRGTGVTDDEDVYFRVYNIEENSIITVYSGFKAFLLADWKK